MSLTVAKPALKTALMTLANNTNDEETKDQAIDDFLNALETWIKASTITVPGTGLIAPSGGGPVTGVSITGGLT